MNLNKWKNSPTAYSFFSDAHVCSVNSISYFACLKGQIRGKRFNTIKSYSFICVDPTLFKGGGENYCQINGHRITSQGYIPMTHWRQHKIIGNLYMFQACLLTLKAIIQKTFSSAGNVQVEMFTQALLKKSSQYKYEKNKPFPRFLLIKSLLWSKSNMWRWGELKRQKTMMIKR